MITVVIPLYNKERSILDTVHSVLAQTYKDFELVIVNDGSTDSSLHIVQAIDDVRVVIVNKENGGVSSARNTGILAAKTNYIAFLDGDDIWHPEHLRILAGSMMMLDNDEVGGVGSSFYKSNSKQFDGSKFKREDTVIIDDYFSFMSSSAPRFNSSTLMVKKDKVLETGLFDEQLKYGEDVDFWYRLFSKYKLIYNKAVTTIYFIGAENRSVHYVMPLERRFHQFDYADKTASEKKYLDKLVALIVLDYFNQKAYKQVGVILKMYASRMVGVMLYFIGLIKKKLK